MQDIINASNLVFKSLIRYPQISVKAEDATFLSGASGCGKSTLLKLFNGTVSPDSGTILYRGTDIETLDTIKLRQNVLLAGQAVFLFHGTIQENFQQYHAYRGTQPPSKETAEQLLNLCCADFSLDASCNTMSGGERQRVYVAIAMSLAPDILMLDEPTSALDSSTAKTFLGNIKQYCKEHAMTLVVVSHDKKLTDDFADHVIHLEKVVF